MGSRATFASLSLQKPVGLSWSPYFYLPLGTARVPALREEITAILVRTRASAMPTERASAEWNSLRSQVASRGARPPPNIPASWKLNDYPL